MLMCFIYIYEILDIIGCFFFFILYVLPRTKMFASGFWTCFCLWFICHLALMILIACFQTQSQKASKRKKIHAFKSKMRMEQLEVTQNKRQNAWQQFQSTKGKAKKVLFSIFATIFILTLDKFVHLILGSVTNNSFLVIVLNFYFYLYIHFLVSSKYELCRLVHLDTTRLDWI